MSNNIKFNDYYQLTKVDPSGNFPIVCTVSSTGQLEVQTKSTLDGGLIVKGANSETVLEGNLTVNGDIEYVDPVFPGLSYPDSYTPETTYENAIGELYSKTAKVLTITVNNDDYYYTGDHHLFSSVILLGTNNNTVYHAVDIFIENSGSNYAQYDILEIDSGVVGVSSNGKIQIQVTGINVGTGEIQNVEFVNYGVYSTKFDGPVTATRISGTGTGTNAQFKFNWRKGSYSIIFPDDFYIPPSMFFNSTENPLMVRKESSTSLLSRNPIVYTLTGVKLQSIDLVGSYIVDSFSEVPNGINNRSVYDFVSDYDSYISTSETKSSQIIISDIGDVLTDDRFLIQSHDGYLGNVDVPIQVVHNDTDVAIKYGIDKISGYTELEALSKNTLYYDQGLNSMKPIPVHLKYLQDVNASFSPENGSILFYPDTTGWNASDVSRTYEATINTANATPTVLRQLVLADGTTLTGTIMVHGYGNTSNLVYSKIYKVCISRTDVDVIKGSVFDEFNIDATGWSISLLIDGTDRTIIQVTGDPSETVTWVCRIDAAVSYIPFTP